MKIIKETLKYIVIFLVSVVILTTLLVLVAKIPRRYVDKNLKEAVSYCKENPNEITMVNKMRRYTWLYPHADQIALNIIYCLDSDKPLEAVMEDKFYTRFEYDGSNRKYVDLIENDLEPNTQYLRYWQGQVLIIKPLLMIMTLEEMYTMNVFILVGLLVILFVLLIKNKYWSIVCALIIGLIMTGSWVVPYSIAYMAMYMLMLITSIVAVIIEQKYVENRNVANKKLYITFFITGILTCFFDVLTTEILTILVPILIVLSMRIKNNKFENLKNEFLFLIKSGILWFGAYTVMWFAKWILASLVLNINAFDYVRNEAMKRVNGTISDFSTLQIIDMGIKRNFLSLIPFDILINKNWHIITSIFFPLLLILLTFDKKDKCKLGYLFLTILISLLPYARYIVLSNHSFLHCFFTFRCQLVTIMGIVLIFFNCMDTKRMFEQVSIKKKK